MLILLGVALVAAVFVVTLLASAGRRSGGLVDLGAVSTQWLVEHREYQDGNRSR